jgi:ABC-type polysaccharide/polyol phosphate export permease
VVGELVRYRQLLLSLIWRDVRVRYKQSLLGIGWAVLLPVSMMLIFTFVFTKAIDGKRVMGIDMPYAIYAYVGLVPWTFFSMGLTGCVNSLVANRNLVTKVYFPREVFPLSCVGSSLVDFAIGCGVLVGLAGYFEATGQWSFAATRSLLLVPVLVLMQMALTAGIGMLLAMANLFYRDVRQVIGVAIQMLMFVSGVVVPVPTDGSLLARVISANPMVPIIAAYRDCVVSGAAPPAGPLVYAAVVSCIALLAGWWCFRGASHRFAECI